VITGEKAVITSLTHEPGRLGWMLPCEAFKGRAKLLGAHCSNIEDISLLKARDSEYFKAAAALAVLWIETGGCCEETCLGQWVIKITDKDGNIVKERLNA
jgi:hypothetical protein